MKKAFTSCCALLTIIYSFSQLVGIGTTNPTLAKLQVNGVSGSGNTSAIFGGDATGVSFQRDWPTVGFNQYRDNTAGNGKYISDGFAAVQYLDPGTGNMYLDMFSSGTSNALTSSGTRALTIGNTGNIGIKTTAANASLYAVKAGSFNGAAEFGGTGNHSFFAYGNEENTYIRGGLSTSNVIINDIPGKIFIGNGGSFVGINTASPITTLDLHQVNGKGYLIVDPVNSFHNYEFHVGYYSAAPESDLKVYFDGLFVGVFSVNGFYTYVTSDERIKTNIQPMPSVLKKLMMLHPRVYEMKDFNENHEKTFGFIAQDVKQVYPEFVSVKKVTVDSANHIPDLHSLNYSGFDVIAIKALQEQYEQLKELKKKNEDLLDRLKAIEEKVAAHN